MEDTVTQFSNCFILRNHEILKEDLFIRHGKFLNPESLFYDERRQAELKIDCQGLLICPGLIDIQINGGFGIDFAKISADSNLLEEVTQKLFPYGVTSICPTIVTSPKRVYDQVIPNVKKSKGGKNCANILGLHLEGPFIAKAKKGAHPENCLKDLSNGFQDVLDLYGSLENVAIITLAPELDYPHFPVIRECTKQGVIIALGHSEATLETAEAAVRSGAAMVTHLFNAMNGFHHRADPGFLGLLDSIEHQSVFYGLISDGIHANSQALKLAYRTNKKGMVLVSDAISAMGLKPGEKCWYGQHEIELKDSKAVIAGTDILCGASTSVYHCMKNLIESAKVNLIDALEAATLHPAQALGIADSKGTLDFGADADFVLLNSETLEIRSTWIHGECVYKK